MDFFSSVFSTTDQDQQEEEEKEKEQLEASAADKAAAKEEEVAAEAEEDDKPSGGDGGWSFGGLIKTFASRSESVIESYRRDLQDLGSGLRIETAAIRAAAARAAAALPGALEAGASAASDSLESVGQAVDDLGAAAAVLLSHANDALLSADGDGDGDNEAPFDSSDPDRSSWRPPLSAKKYTRFEAQVLALRADPATFTEEPKDAEGFAKWRSTFWLDERQEDIEGVLRESPGLESFVERLVPGIVDYEAFWCRYFFRVDKLRQAEDVRAKLVNRAMSKEEEELSWEVDDADDNENVTVDKKEKKIWEPSQQEEEKSQEQKAQYSEKQEAIVEKDVVVAWGLAEDKKHQEADDKEIAMVAAKDENGESNGEESTPKSGDGTAQEGKTEAGDSSKESDLSVVSRPSMQEEDLSWEEIEDVGDQEDKRAVNPQLSHSRKVDQRKRVSSAEDDEELSWDAEEEDEPVKPLIEGIRKILI